MKKVLILILLVVLVSVSFATQEEDNVDDKVIQALETQEKVDVIIVLEDAPNIGIASDMKEEVTDKLSEDEFKKKHEFSVINGLAGEVDAEGLEKLRNDPNVKKVYYDYPVSAFLADSIPLINASVAHSLQINGVNITGQGETVCVIDTGVNYTHESLGGCDNETFLAGDCSKVLGGYDFVNDDLDPYDDNGHGTHVAGIIAANGTVLGVAPGANIVAVKVLGSNGIGYSSGIASGIEYCVDNSTLYGISVISMSLGSDILYNSYCNDDYLASFINAAIAKNITVTIASGNNGNTTNISSPACVENSTSVGWTNKDDTINSQSNRNSITDLLAPGTGILSTWIDGLTKSESGTSMATPHVAGAVALLQQFNKEEKGEGVLPSEILNVLNKTGKQIQDSGGSELTFSRIDVWQAILELTKPVVSLSEPINNSVLGNESVDFNVTFDDYNELLDCSLYIDNSLNQTNNISSGEIFYSVLSDGNHNSSVDCYDNLSQVGSSDLINFRIDLTEPTVYLETLDNETFAGGSSPADVSFDFNVSDVEIGNCSLLIDGNVNITSANISVDTSETIQDQLDNGTYLWSVQCYDLAEWSGVSEERRVNVCVESWSCGNYGDYGSWSECSGGKRTRTRTRICTDINSCGTTISKPSETDTETDTSCDSSSSSSGGSGGGSSGGSSSSSESSVTGDTVKQVDSSFVFSSDPGEINKFEFNEDNGLTGLELTLSDAVVGAAITVTKTNTKPSSVTDLDTSVYTYIQVDKNELEDSNIQQALMKFKVEKGWLNNNKGNVVLSRYNEGWKKLPTTKADEDSDYVHYEAISPGFSVFAVTVEEQVLGTSGNETSNESSGLEPLTGFIGKNLPSSWVEWINNKEFVKSSLDKIQGLNSYYWIGSLVFVCLLVATVVFRKKIFNKAGHEEKEFVKDEKHKKLREEKKSKEEKLEEKKKEKIEKLKKQLGRLEEGEHASFLGRIKGKFRKEKGDVHEDKPEVKREEVEKERGAFALFKKDTEVSEVKVEKKEEKKSLFSGFKQKMEERRQRKEELHKRFEFKDIKK